MQEIEFYSQEKSGLRFTENPEDSGYHTATDWNLYWTDFKLTAPAAKKYTVTVPGRHGILDMSEALTGDVVYHNGTLTAVFAFPSNMPDWHKLYSRILTYLHGRRRCIIVDTDPRYYYEGRCSVSSVREDGVHSTFTVTADVYPYKRTLQSTVEPWLWDPFDFVEGIVPDYLAELTIPAGSTLTVTTHRELSMPITPIITVDQPCTLEFGGEAYTLESGVNEDIIWLDAGENVLTFAADTETALQIEFREGTL